MRRLAPPVAVLVVLALSSPAGAQVVNEFIVNHSGPDLYEFLEIQGEPSTDYSDLTILEIDGDSVGDPGLVESAWPVGTTDAAGIWWTGFLGDNFPTNDSLSFVLVRDWSGTAGLTDIDTNDDGAPDVTPWTEVLDAVGVDDLDADFWYGGATVLSANFDGVTFVPGGASRIPSGTDSESVGDWRRNDFDGAGLPLPGGTVDGNEAANTPGTENSTDVPPPPPPLISEVVADHVDPDTFELVEIFGEPQLDYSTYTVFVVDGSSAPGTVTNVFPCGTTNIAGFWTTGPLAEAIPDFTTKTVLLASGFTGAASDDLDTNDDGVFDLAPWDGLHDSVTISDGFGLAYSTAVVTHAGLRSVPAPGGVSRFPWFTDTDSAADWVINDYDGAGIDGFPGSIARGEAYNTPDRVNRIHVPDLYAPVDWTSEETFRASLHEVVDDHVRHPYSSSSFPDTWDILESADEDPANPSNILDVYRNASIPKFGGGTGPYNREHTWPNSYGFGTDGPTNYAYTDCHHLFLSDGGYNSDRSNKPFDDCNAACTERTTEENGGVGGGSGGYPGWSNWFDGDSWETWLDRRGDLARAQFYMDVRYDGGVHGESGASEPDLVLTDDPGLIVTTSSSPAYMGILSTLLEWHTQDPADAKERRHNEEVWKHQGNRNPFVDRPEWVECVFVGGCVFLDGFESGDASAWSGP